MVVADQPSVRIQRPVAPFGSRLAAQVLDWLVTFILTSAFMVAAGLYLLISSDMARRDPSDRAILTAALVAAMAVPAWCVVTLAGFTWHGRSVGKLAMNLRVVAGDGRPPGIGRSLVRLVVYILELAPLAAIAPVIALVLAWRPAGVLVPALVALGGAAVLPLVSLGLVLRDREHRALHDLLAGTVVIVD